MRSRRDGVDLQATIERAKAVGLCGFGGAKEPPPDDRLARRIARFTEIDDGSFGWTRDADGLYWLPTCVQQPNSDKVAVRRATREPCGRWVIRTAPRS
jgi:hypothetical protein